MLIFLAALAEITNQPKSKQNTYYRGGFYVQQVSVSCLAFPKESNMNEYLERWKYIFLQILRFLNNDDKVSISNFMKKLLRRFLEKLSAFSLNYFD
jgi:hypothetical protein